MCQSDVSDFIGDHPMMVYCYIILVCYSILG